MTETVERQLEAFNHQSSGLFSLISAVVVSFLVYIFIHYRVYYSHWDKKNVKGPKPWPLVGNFAHLLYNKKKYDLKWRKEFGRFYGIYQASKPVLVTSDAELIQQICIKDFENFQNHERNEFANKYMNNFLFSLRGEHWKKVRALMSPTFTSGKIKRMFRFMDRCADDLMAAYHEQLDSVTKSAVTNVKDTYNLFSMDVIATCCYGLKLERANAVNLKSAAARNEFVEMANKVFTFDIKRILFGVVIPKPLLRFFGYTIVSVKPVEPMINKVSQLIEARKRSEKKFDDYLQLLIDAKLDDELELNDMDAAENHHAGLTRESLLDDQKRLSEQVKSMQVSSKIKLTDMEIITNATFLLAVGLETTSSLLTNVSVALAHHQDIQAHLHEELLKIAEYNEDKTRLSFSYEALTSCRYLDAVLSETLRLLSPVFMTDRQATKDYYIEKYNLNIPAGQVFHINWYAAMNDPEYWEEPTRFDPERFMPDNKDKILPGSYAPFGYGPRHCVGMRFSLTESKLALAKMIMNFKFEPAPGSTFPPILAPSLGLAKLKRPEVKLVSRI